MEEHTPAYVTVSNMLTDISQLEPFDVAGFDADHTLVKYNVKALTKMIDKIYMRVITEDCEGYPKDIADLYDEELINFSFNGATLDMNTGLLVKISEDKKVIATYRGFTKLPDTEIEEIYGKDRIFNEEYSVWHYRSLDKGYLGFHSYFDCPVISLCAKLFDLKTQGKIDKTNEEIFNDIRTCIIKSYVHYDAEKCYKIADYGYFFTEIINDTEKYIQRREDFREMLIKLREAGKKVFIATNSHAEYTNLIMTRSIGDDWRSLVDFTASHCGKPIFFKEIHGTRKFFRCDYESVNLKGKECDVDDLEETHTYLEGNCKDLEEYFKKLIDKDEINFAFFGDHFITDAAISDLHKNWKGVAIMEELNHEQVEQTDESQLVGYEKYWGSFFGGEINGEWHKNAWVKFAEEHTSYVLPLLGDLKKLLDK